MNYYNDIDPFCCSWIKELIYEGLIPRGEVDSRDIRDIPPGDLRGYVGVHFFAGIGGWAYALRLAGWPDNKPIWSGSCPCQPFSVAGKGAGLEDERHLWPAFRWLIAQCRPKVIVGEQVASIDGVSWLTGVYDDLEALGYTVPTDGNGLHELYDIPAAGIGAPHIRQRLFWVGIAQGVGLQKSRQEQGCPPEPSGCDFWLADAEPQHDRSGESGAGRWPEPANIGSVGGMANAEQHGYQGRRAAEQPASGVRRRFTDASQPNFFANSVPILCADGKWRRVPGRVVQSGSAGSQSGGEAAEGAGHWGSIESAGGRIGGWEIEPALFPLANGISNRVGILRGAGNSVCAPLTAKFIKVVMEALNG